MARPTIYNNIVRKPIFFLADVEFKRDLERLAAKKHVTLSSLIQSASMEYLKREVKEMQMEMTV